MGSEIVRLNNLLASNQQSFCKLYQSLIEKKKQIDLLEKQKKAAIVDAAGRVAVIEDKCGKALSEAQTLRVGPINGRKKIRE